MDGATSHSLLRVEGLKVHFWTEEGILQAVRGIDISVKGGEVLGIVGESGCGKSVTALSILRLISCPPGRVEGKILFLGQDLLKLSLREMRKINGSRISMIFQEPMTCLNPLYSIGDQIMEAILLHQSVDRKRAHAEALSMLDRVGIPDPHLRMKYYPYQLSGGMRQRVMIAIALSCQPELLIADEPTTALDVTIQAQIIDLLERLKEEMKTSLILITHNLALVKNITSRLAIMYAGKIVEEGPTRELFQRPFHPYTKGLLACIPLLKGKRSSLSTIAGALPSPLESIAGCAFYPRCPAPGNSCRQEEPTLEEWVPGHRVACRSCGGDQGL